MKRLKLQLGILIGLLIFSCSSNDDSSNQPDVPNVPVCGLPSNITVNNITNTTATINWTELF